MIVLLSLLVIALAARVGAYGRLAVRERDLAVHRIEETNREIRVRHDIR